MSDKVEFGAKQTAWNMISQAVSFLVNMLIGFFLTPFIVENVGTEANGFVQLSAQFISYMTLITTAVSSMAGRFIAISFFKGEKENVSKYYSSVAIANIFLCLILSIPFAILIAFLPRFINITPTLVNHVRLLFILMFTHFFIDVLSVWGVSGYVMNRLDLVARRKTEATILKGVFTFAFFAIFIPRVWYVGLIQLLCTIYNVFRNYQIHKKLMPDIKIRRRDFEFGKVKELTASGIWNSISSLGSILMGGLDLLIVNLAIDDTAMGQVSLAKYIPIYISSLVVTLANVFAPKQTKMFAENDFVGMKNTLISSTKIMSLITCLPVAFVIVYGRQFFSLWVASENAELLWKIAIVAVCFYPISLSASPFSAIITSTNKVRINSLVTLGFSAISLLTMFVSLSFVQEEFIKMVIIVGTSALFGVLQILTFLIPYCGKIIGCKTTRFYLVLLQSIVAVAITCTICFLISNIFNANTWLKLILSGVIVCVVGGVVSIITVLGRKERKQIFNKLKTKLLKKKENN